jgi:hypothetical protein
MSHSPTDSGAWRIQVVISFILSLALTTGGILYLPVDRWMQAYLGMGLYFCLSSAFALAKSVRDTAELEREEERRRDPLRS